MVIILIILVLLLIFLINQDSEFSKTDPIFKISDLKRNHSIKQSHIDGSVKLNIKVCEENLLLFNKIMKQFDIFYWLSEGTALGVIRENRLLPWDDDVDISFKIEYRDKFVKEALPVLKENGFVIADVFHDGNFITLLRNDEKIDIDIVQKDGKCMALATSNTNYNRDCNNLLSYLNNIHPVQFLETEFNVPGDDYLEFLYSKDWKTPKKDK